MPKVTVTLKGKFTQRDASIDDMPIVLVGAADAESGSCELPPGDHRLRWIVLGAPSGGYSVTIAGGGADWSDNFSMIDGRGIGSVPFKVKS